MAEGLVDSGSGGSMTVDTVVRMQEGAEAESPQVRSIVVDSPEWVELIALRREAAGRRRQDELDALRREAAAPAVEVGSGRWVIAVPYATEGVMNGVGGLIFIDGVTTTDNVAAVAYCQGAGYVVKDLHASLSAVDPGDGSESPRVARTR